MSELGKSINYDLIQLRIGPDQGFSPPISTSVRLMPTNLTILHPDRPQWHGEEPYQRKLNTLEVEMLAWIALVSISFALKTRGVPFLSPSQFAEFAPHFTPNQFSHLGVKLGGRHGILEGHRGAGRRLACDPIKLLHKLRSSKPTHVIAVEGPEIWTKKPAITNHPIYRWYARRDITYIIDVILQRDIAQSPEDPRSLSVTQNNTADTLAFPLALATPLSPEISLDKAITPSREVQLEEPDNIVEPDHLFLEAINIIRHFEPYVSVDLIIAVCVRVAGYISYDLFAKLMKYIGSPPLEREKYYNIILEMEESAI